MREPEAEGEERVAARRAEALKREGVDLMLHGRYDAAKERLEQAVLLFESELLATSDHSVLHDARTKKRTRIGGVVAVVSAFGKDMNNAMNKLWGRKDSDEYKTKVVPIISVGKGTAIGAAQVMGPENMVDQVAVVAQPETSLMGVRMKALIPVSDKNVNGGLKVVKGVGVSGIVDLKL